MAKRRYAMRKYFKRSLVMVLVVVMMMSVVSPAFAATKENVKQYSDFCFIGDSVCNGFGYLSLNFNSTVSTNDANKRDAHYGNVSDNTFVGMVRDAIGARFHSDICVGQNLVDALWVTGAWSDDEYDYEEAYWYHVQHQKQPQRWQCMNYMHDSGEAANRIRQSSLVGIYLGSNDLFNRPRNAATASNGEFDMDLFLDMALEAYDRFVFGYPKLIERVRELNPTAKIVILSLYNPYANIKANADDENYTIGSLMTLYINNANFYLKQWAKYYGCTYVDITEVSTSFPEFDITDPNFIAKFSAMDIHPTEEWNHWIADRIIEALPEATSQVSSPVSGQLAFEFDGKDAGDYLLRKKTIGWTIRDENGYYANYNADTQSIQMDREKSTTRWLYYGGDFLTVALEKTTFTGPFKYLHTWYRPTVKYLDFDAGGLVAGNHKVNITMYKDN